MCFLREINAESAMRYLELTKPYWNWLVEVGLDSDEKDNPPIKFAEVFKEAKVMGLKLTMYCELKKQNSLIHIKRCISDI